MVIFCSFFLFITIGMQNTSLTSICLDAALWVLDGMAFSDRDEGLLDLFELVLYKLFSYLYHKHVNIDR